MYTSVPGVMLSKLVWITHAAVILWGIATAVLHGFASQSQGTAGQPVMSFSGEITSAVL